MNQLLKQVLLVCVCLFALTGQAMADSLSDAKHAYDAGDYEKAAKLYSPLAKNGNAEAQSYLGWMYTIGHGVSQDSKEAMKWYRLAAEQGVADAQFNVGVGYDKGDGVPQDNKEAVKWYRLAAEQGVAAAQFNLGLGYEEGKGVPQDYVLAYMWVNIATANKDSIEGQKYYIKLRDFIAGLMTAKQIAEAQELARRCTTNKFKGCQRE